MEKQKESKICGKHASRAVFNKRPSDIVRVFVHKKTTSEFGDLLKYCAENHMPYRVVEEEELEKISGARHHEGICVVARPQTVPALTENLAQPGSSLLLALDNVSNPHNIGTLLRTAAHFGVHAVLLGGPLKALSAAAYRTAEGAAEHVPVYFASNLEPMLLQCQEAGYALCATSSYKGRSLYAESMPKRSCLLLGAERMGLSAPLTKLADIHLRIPGTDAVESLNVASSSAVLLAEHWRTYQKE